MNIKIDTFSEFTDERGSLIVLNKTSFEVKRIFYVENTPKDVIRGCHAHHDTKQYYFCLRGKIQITLFDGAEQCEIILSEKQGMLIENLMWSSEKFLTGDDLLVVLCSDEYKADYIRTRKELIEIKHKLI